MPIPISTFSDRLAVLRKCSPRFKGCYDVYLGCTSCYQAGRGRLRFWQKFGENVMEQREHHDQGKRSSALDGKREIAGLPPKKKSPVAKAAADKHAADSCNSVLDGPECIRGVPKKRGSKP